MTDTELWDARWLQFKLAVMDKVFFHTPGEEIPNWDNLARNQFTGRIIIAEILTRVKGDGQPQPWSAMVHALKHAGIPLKGYPKLIAAARRVEPK